MNSQRILGLAILIGALGIPFGLSTGAAPPAQTTTGQQAQNKTADANTPPPAEIEFEILDTTSPLVVPIAEGSKQGKVALTINNKGKSPITVWYTSVAFRDEAGVPVSESDIWATISPNEKLDAGKAREFQFTFE